VTDSGFGRRSTTVLTAIGCSALATAFLAFYTRFPQVADERLALPIARAAADSTLYPASDLLVSSGLKGPFHLYRLAGLLYAKGLDVDVWWYGILIVAQLATFAALWFLAGGISRSAGIASLVTAVVAAASPYRGTIHWFLLPAPNLVTSTLATPLALAALALAAWGRGGAGIVVAGLTFNLHPSVGLLTGGAIAITMLADRSVPWRANLGWFAAAALAAAPNAVHTAMNSTASLVGGAGDGGLAFGELLRLHTDHAFIAQHWRENYGWFVMQFAGLVALRALLPGDSRRVTLGLTIAFLAFALFWLANLYTINQQGVTLVYALRGAAFVKAIAFSGVAAALAVWVSGVEGRERMLRAIPAGILLVAALHKNLDIGEGAAAVAWAGVILLAWPERRRVGVPVALLLGGAGIVQVLGQGWGILGVAPFSAASVDLARLATICASGAFLAFALCFPLPNPVYSGTGGAGAPHRPLAQWMMALGVLVFAIVLRGDPSRVRPASLESIARGLRISRPDSSATDLVRWAAQGGLNGTLFAIPPADPRLATFRLAAGRGVYATLPEVNQLAYDATHYGAAHTRLLSQGMEVRGPHQFEFSAWDTLSATRVTALAREGVSFAVFDAQRRIARPLALPEVFRDTNWIVYDLRAARSAP
jgi:hypothetical protein